MKAALGALLLTLHAVGAVRPTPVGDSASPTTARSKLEITLVTDPADERFGQVVVAPLPPEARSDSTTGLLAEHCSSVLWVRVSEGELDSPPPILGRCLFDGVNLRFVPRFPFASELPLRAGFEGGYLSRLLNLKSPLPNLQLEDSIPAAPPLSPPVVLQVQPNESVIPANVLRIYLHFSRPMRAAHVAQALRLFDETTGKIVPESFVEVPDGLWDLSQQRLTLLFHPGRVKRGVGPNLAMGPPLLEGGRYRLVVEPGLVDLAGRPMIEPFEHRFTVGAALRSRLQPASWELRPPNGSLAPLELVFPRPLDSALLQRSMTVRGPGGIHEGTIPSSGGRRWRFEPADPWLPGPYEIHIDPRLEDVAGNRIDSAFDREIGPAEGSDPRGPGKAVPPKLVLTFSVPATGH